MVIAIDKLTAFARSTSTEPILANAFDLWNIEYSLHAVHAILVMYNHDHLEGFADIDLKGTCHGIEMIISQLKNDVSDIVDKGMENFQSIVKEE